MSSERGAEGLGIPSNDGGRESSRTTFGKYQLIAALGSGGMADVYLAVSKGLARFNKLVVLKCLRKRWLEEELGEEGARSDQREFVEMFLEEARLAARLNHPNIVQTNEVGEESGDYFIAMEFLEGQSLNRITNRAWRKGQGVPVEIAVTILCEALAALHHAHELRDFDGKQLEIVHRDASPHNVFVTYEGQTKLVDFGIAKATTRSFETRTGVLKGKIQYMAPEQARCTDVDRRADVFSVGVVLWEVIARRRMWAGLPDIQVLQKLVSEPVPSIRELVPDLPEGLEAIIKKATAFDRDARYATAEDMRLDLYAYAKANLTPTTSKEIGAYVAAEFADKRALVASIIEHQFIQIRRGEDISLNVMDPPTTQSLSRSQADLSHDGDGSNPSNSARRREGPPTLASVATSNVSGYPPRSSKKGLWIGAVVVGVAAIATAALVSNNSDGGSANNNGTSGAANTTAQTTNTSAPGGSTATSAGGPTTPAPAVPDPNNIKLTVKAKPSNATIYVDDVAVEGNPYVAQFRKDGANHRVRAEADGHTTEKKLVQFDQDRELSFELNAKPGVRITDIRPYPRPPPPPTGTTAPPPPSTPPPPPPPADTTNKGPGKPPPRPLDKQDPWKKP